MYKEKKINVTEWKGGITGRHISKDKIEAIQKERKKERKNTDNRKKAERIKMKCRKVQKRRQSKVEEWKRKNKEQNLTKQEKKN